MGGAIIALTVRAVNSHSVVLRIIPTHSVYPRHLVLFVLGDMRHYWKDEANGDLILIPLPLSSG